MEHSKFTRNLSFLISVERILLDDDDDVIVLPQEEPVITEIPDDDDAPTSTVVSSDVAVEQIDSTFHDGASTSGAVTSSTTGDEQVNATYESIGNESDLQILVPQISVVDVEEFEDKPIDPAQNSVKIKEEPKDDGYDEDDDGFEDIGTFEEATIIEDNSGEYIISRYILAERSICPVTFELIPSSTDSIHCRPITI